MWGKVHRHAAEKSAEFLRFPVVCKSDGVSKMTLCRIGTNRSERHDDDHENFAPLCTRKPDDRDSCCSHSACDGKIQWGVRCQGQFLCTRPARGSEG